MNKKKKKLAFIILQTPNLDFFIVSEIFIKLAINYYPIYINNIVSFLTTSAINTEIERAP